MQQAQGCARAVFALRRSRRTRPPLPAVCCLDIFPEASMSFVTLYRKTTRKTTTLHAIDIVINIQVKVQSIKMIKI